MLFKLLWPQVDLGIWDKPVKLLVGKLRIVRSCPQNIRKRFQKVKAHENS